jgi:hypothetical protein
VADERPVTGPERSAYLDGQCRLAHSSVAQHHQLIQRHLPRHSDRAGERSVASAKRSVLDASTRMEGARLEDERCGDP